MRWLAVLWMTVVAGCSKQGPSECATAYAEYERTWKAAWQTEITEMNASSGTPVLDDKITKDLVTSLTDTLPTRAELAKIHEVHTAGNGGRADPPVWLAAWAAAEHAIDVCGENAKPALPR